MALKKDTTSYGDHVTILERVHQGKRNFATGFFN